MPNIGAPELAIVLVIALIVFGPKRLPELGRSLGNGMREFKNSITGSDDDEEKKLEATKHELEASEPVEGEVVTDGSS